MKPHPSPEQNPPHSAAELPSPPSPVGLTPEGALPAPEPVPDARLPLVQAWLAQLPEPRGLQLASLRAASSDASFRRYFRIDGAADSAGNAASPRASYIVMDAPPDKEDCGPFVQVAQLLADQGVSTPRILAQDLGQGLLLLTDFGNTTYSDALAHEGVDIHGLYSDALDTLVRIQRAPTRDLPAYDSARLLAEMHLFTDWYVPRHLGLTLEPADRAILDESFALLAQAAQAQGQVVVHRDYHCRNLMVLDRASAPSADPVPATAPGCTPRLHNPGVIDFQDACVGPVAYDLVSLLRDAYVEWPEALQIDWAARYWEQARAAGLPVPTQFDVFWRDMEWIGLQRALKVLGIFARLCYRDGKARYLADLPLVLRHTQTVVERYDRFHRLARLLDRLHQRTSTTGFSF